MTFLVGMVGLEYAVNEVVVFFGENLVPITFLCGVIGAACLVAAYFKGFVKR